MQKNNQQVKEKTNFKTKKNWQHFSGRGKMKQSKQSKQKNRERMFRAGRKRFNKVESSKVIVKVEE
jgi:hypothetical protein